MSIILDRLRKELEKEAEKGRFQYIFIAGDIANGSDYSMVEQRITELLLNSGILEDTGAFNDYHMYIERLFWSKKDESYPHKVIHTEQALAAPRNYFRTLQISKN